MEKKKKIRIDLLLFQRGLAPSRERAQALILTGNVLVEDVPVTQAGTRVSEDVEIRIRGLDHPYVSRGGLKLEKAIQEFDVSVERKIALDLGASTGGFTQVLLNHGAQKVFAVDVGHLQMDWKIRTDPRVINLEKTNARSLSSEQITEKVQIVVADVSFISLTLVIPPTILLTTPDADWITLIKPQFEAGKDAVKKGGIVTDPVDRQQAIKRVTDHFETLGLIRVGLIESPVLGTQGNHEYLAHWKRRFE